MRGMSTWLFGWGLMLGLAGPARAQVATELPSPSVDGIEAAEGVPVVSLPAIDDGPLRDEDARAPKDQPYRFGVRRDVSLGLSGGGVWDVLPDGRRRWRAAVTAQGAKAISVEFSRFDLPPDAWVWIHDGEGVHRLGAFGEPNLQPSGLLATSLLPGDTAVIEYVEPVAPAWTPELEVGTVVHAYRDVFDLKAATGGPKAFGSSFGCNNNANCAIGSAWRDQQRSVAMLVVNGSGFCTGALVNNAAEDGRPFLLTANHCLGGSVANWVFWFNWEAPTCADPGQPPLPDTMSGAVLRARRSASDFALLELTSGVPVSYDPYFAGWDASGDQPQSAVGIHHPAGDIKKISLENSPLTLDSYGGGSGTHWRVNGWDDGTTEGGSSGSPLFDGTSGRIVGQLHGGDYGCNGIDDWYGRVSVSWDAGRDASERLEDWLDPQGTTGGAMDGYDPGAPTTPLDASIAAVVSPSDGGVVCDDPALEVRLVNRGLTPLTSAEFEVRVDGGPWVDAGTWSGRLTTGDGEAVTLDPVALTPGPRSLTARVRRPNGGTDGRPTNDEARVSVIRVIDTPEGPGSEGFESGVFPPSGWRRVDDDALEAWERTTAASWTGSASALFDNFDEYAPGSEDRLVGPLVDLSGLQSAILRFEVAYARYDNRLFDGLQVVAQAGCGAPEDLLYDKVGTQLATVPDVPDPYVPTSASEWRTESIDLSAYVGGVVRLSFVNLSGWGNNLYLDDIRIEGLPLEPVDTGDPVDPPDTDVPVDTGDSGTPVDPPDSGDPLDTGDSGAPVDPADTGGPVDPGDTDPPTGSDTDTDTDTGPQDSSSEPDPADPEDPPVDSEDLAEADSGAAGTDPLELTPRGYGCRSGCAATGGSGAPAPWVALLGVLGVLSRRRHR